MARPRNALTQSSSLRNTHTPLDCASHGTRYSSGLWASAIHLDTWAAPWFQNLYSDRTRGDMEFASMAKGVKKTGGRDGLDAPKKSGSDWNIAAADV